MENGNDLISRRKAFEYFVTLWECIGTIMDRDEWEDVCMTTANEIPSAQPERKKGSWNVIQGNIVVCSECGMCAPKSMTGCLLNRHLEPNRTNFCPNCGADMRGDEE